MSVFAARRRRRLWGLVSPRGRGRPCRSERGIERIVDMSVFAARRRHRGRRLCGLVRPCPLAGKVERSDMAAKEDVSNKKNERDNEKTYQKPASTRAWGRGIDWVVKRTPDSYPAGSRVSCTRANP